MRGGRGGEGGAEGTCSLYAAATSAQPRYLLVIYLEVGYDDGKTVPHTPRSSLHARVLDGSERLCERAREQAGVLLRARNGIRLAGVCHACGRSAAAASAMATLQGRSASTPLTICKQQPVLPFAHCRTDGGEEGAGKERLLANVLIKDAREGQGARLLAILVALGDLQRQGAPSPRLLAEQGLERADTDLGGAEAHSRLVDYLHRPALAGFALCRIQRSEPEVDLHPAQRRRRCRHDDWRDRRGRFVYVGG